MSLDWNLRFGDLVVVVTLLVYIFRAGAFTNSVSHMEKRIDTIEDTLKSLAAAMTTVAVQKDRIERMDRDINELRHGQGFVRGRLGIEGEYP